MLKELLPEVGKSTIGGGVGHMRSHKIAQATIKQAWMSYNTSVILLLEHVPSYF